jgi:hypothetical protein
MMNIKMLVLAVGAVALLAGCGGRNDAVEVVPPVTNAVPAEAATSSTVATQYVADLSAVPADQTDTLEPISVLPDSLASDDAAEPRLID